MTVILRYGDQLASISVRGRGSIQHIWSLELMRAHSFDTELRPTSKDLWRRTSWPQDALNFNARFPGCSVSGAWVLEACIRFLWESVPDFSHDTGRENFPISLPETPTYQQHKYSVWDMSIGPEYIEILSTLCCLLLNCSLIFFSLLSFNKTSTASTCIQYTVRI